MKFGPGLPGRRGIALILVLSLLALLVLLTLALAALSRVDAQIVATSLSGVQARRNALLALDVALDELQQTAGADDRVTAMAGVSGVPPGNAGNRRRHWCGVWNAAGGFIGWLASGATSALPPTLRAGVEEVVLVANGSVGAPATNSEHVAVGRIPLIAPDAPGGIAWWVGDEGVKMSLHVPPSERMVPDVTPMLAGSPAVSANLRTALTTHAAKLPALLSFEQVRLLPTPASSPLTNSTVWDNFHHVTLTARWCVLVGNGVPLRAGRVNLNTTSTVVWRGIAETYNALPSLPDIPASRLAGFATVIASGLAADASGKSAAAPYGSVPAFLGSALLDGALQGSEVKPADFAAGMGNLLTVRSDTFRVRGAGDSTNPATGEIEARAWCEAIVQRVPAKLGDELGRRFIITYFRWLGPEDI